MDDITSGNTDIYAEFGVAPDASSAEITKKFRQMALRYHPDKNPSAEAAAKFQFFSAVYSVLQDPALRKQYDDIRRQRGTIPNRNVSENVESQILKFKQQLHTRENEAKRQKFEGKSRSGADVEILAMRGLNLRREYQEKLQHKKGYVSYRDIDVPKFTGEFIVPTTELEVTWKHRTEQGAQIDADTLRLIMQKFGPVRTCAVNGSDGRYVKGTVTFETGAGAEKALAYDYKSAHLWDGTSVRKLASLLRSVRRIESPVQDGSAADDVDSLFGEIDKIMELCSPEAVSI